MNRVLRRGRTERWSTATVTQRAAMLNEVAFEVVPTKQLALRLTELPTNARVSVTCSPAQGVDVTVDICERLAAAGHRPIPHLSARQVSDRAHLQRLVRRSRDAGIDRAFVIGGDGDPTGGYGNAEALLADLLDTEHPFTAIGVAGYPDGHALIDRGTLHDALHRKQALLDAAGVDGWCSTQMCFDATLIEHWLAEERFDGMKLPVHLGIAGAVDRAKLVATGLRIGVGQSLQYLRKNRASLTRILTTRAYDPDDLLLPLAEPATTYQIDGLHLFTFNQIAATRTWLATARRR